MAENTLVYRGFLTVEKTANGMEVVRTTDSVAFLLVDFARELVLLVSQHRAPMVRPDNPDGTILEVPAGRFDVALGVQELAVKEAREELGVSITADQVVLLNGGEPLALSPGILTERTYLAMVELNLKPCESSRAIFGNAHEGERTERVAVSFVQLESMVIHDMKTMALVGWLLREIDKRRERSRA